MRKLRRRSIIAIVGLLKWCRWICYLGEVVVGGRSESKWKDTWWWALDDGSFESEWVHMQHGSHKLLEANVRAQDKCVSMLHKNCTWWWMVETLRMNECCTIESHGSGWREPWLCVCVCCMEQPNGRSDKIIEDLNVCDCVCCMGYIYTWCQ